MKVTSLPKDIQTRFLVVTQGKHTWQIGEPDENGLRDIEYDGRPEGKGIVLGSVKLVGGNCQVISPNIQVGDRLGVEFPERAEGGSVLVSPSVTAIFAKESKQS